MLDAYVFLGLAPENPDDRDTADGRPMTRIAARARLARMRCADPEDFSEAEASSLAEDAVRAQRLAVVQACGRVLAERPDVRRIVLSGSGEIVGRAVAQRWGKPVTFVAQLLGPGVSEAACAYAVATLAAQERP